MEYEIEPFFIIQSKKIKCDETHVLGIPLCIWRDLLFTSRILEVVDLINIRRTCKAFACYKDLKRMVKKREKAAFKGLDSKFWNKAGNIYDYDDDILGVVKEHYQKFVVLEISMGRGRKVTLTAYSTYRRLWEHLQTTINTHLGKNMTVGRATFVQKTPFVYFRCNAPYNVSRIDREFLFVGISEDQLMEYLSKIPNHKVSFMDMKE